MEFFTNLQSLGDWGLLALRVAVGIIFVVHGKNKWVMWQRQPSEQMSAGMLSTMRFLSIVEPLGGLAVLFGFLTQLAAVGLGLVMLGALYFQIAKWHKPFTALDKLGWEFDFLLLVCNITLILMGPGTWALDPIIFGL